MFKPSTQDYAKVAAKYEKYNNNNNAFNGRNLSDNSKVTKFTRVKLHGIDSVHPMQSLVTEYEK